MNKSHLLGTVCACLFLITITTVNAAPLTYRFTGQIDTVDSSSTAAVGDSWVALFTFDDSDLMPGLTEFFEDDVLSWQLLVPTDSRFNIGSSTGDSLVSLAINVNVFGDGLVRLWNFEAENGGSIGVGSWTGDVGVYAYHLHGTVYIDFTDTDNLPLVGNQVPIPASIWLFGFGLLGLVGIARRNMTQ